MNRLYRQLPFVLLLLAATIGCTRNDEALLEEATPILTFRPTLEGMEIVPSTRSTVNEVDIATLGFKVVGYHTEEQFPLSDAATASLVPNIFDKIADTDKSVVRTVNAANNWKLPLAKIALDDLESSVRTQFSFFAWTAAASKDEAGSSTSVITKSTAAATDKGYPFLDITLPAPDAQEQGDVVVAHALNAPNDYVVTAVDLDFHHALSKLSIYAKAISGAVVTVKSTAVRYAANSVYTKARYEFNASDSVGCWKSLSTPQAAGDVTPYGFNTPQLGPTTSFLGSLLMIPQECKSGALSLVLNYTVTIDGNVSEPITRVLPIEIDLCQGKHYTYTLNIETDRLELINLSVGEWRDAGKAHPMPIIPGPMGDVQLWLDGYDKPYTHTDGKRYWLDRSGYNRHVELTSYYVDYDNTNHCYSFNGTSYNSNQHGGIFQEIPVFQDISAEIVMEGNANVTNSNQPLVMTGATNAIEPRNFLVEMGYSKTTQIALFRGDPNNNIVMFNNASTLPHNEIVKRRYWLFNSMPNQLQIYLDGNLLAESSMQSNIQVNAFKKNVIANGMTGKIFSIKLSSRQTESADVVSRYLTAHERFKTAVAPELNIIPSEVLTAGGWPTNKLPKTGLQVAMRGNLLPGNTASSDDQLTAIVKEFQQSWTGFRPSTNLGDGKTNYALFAVDLDMYLIGKACKDLGPEWYVPSRDELILIYNNRASLGASYSFLPEQYWSASEFTNLRFYVQHFASDGAATGEYEWYPRRVRCVRNID